MDSGHGLVATGSHLCDELSSDTGCFRTFSSVAVIGRYGDIRIVAGWRPWLPANADAIGKWAAPLHAEPVRQPAAAKQNMPSEASGPGHSPFLALRKLRSEKKIPVWGRGVGELAGLPAARSRSALSRAAARKLAIGWLVTATSNRRLGGLRASRSRKGRQCRYYKWHREWR